MRFSEVSHTIERVSKTHVRKASRVVKRVPRFRKLAIVGILITLVAFVLILLALLAGQSPGPLEDYHILLLNTSTLGQNLIPTAVSGGSVPSPTSCGPLRGSLGRLCASATAEVGSVFTSGLAELSSIEDDVAEELTEKLGIQQWYSFHAMAICQGTFSPSPTSANAGYNVTDCAQFQTAFNISSILNHELDVGPLHLNLARIGVTEDLQNELNKITGIVQALAGIYILAVIFSGLSLIFSFWWFVRQPHKLSWTNMTTALTTVVMLLIGNVIVVTSGKLAKKNINDLGQNIGLSVSTGGKFVAVTWVAFVLMVIMTVYWCYEIHKGRRLRKIQVLEATG